MADGKRFGEQLVREEFRQKQRAAAKEEASRDPHAEKFALARSRKTLLECTADEINLLQRLDPARLEMLENAVNNAPAGPAREAQQFRNGMSVEGGGSVAFRNGRRIYVGR